jgi:hypothetical protein
MTIAYAIDNMDKLAQAGIAPTPESVYAAHFLGPGGAKKAYAANPNASAVSVLGQKAVNSNPNVMKGKTIGQVMDYIANKMEGVDINGMGTAVAATEPTEPGPASTPASTPDAGTGGNVPEGPQPGQTYPNAPAAPQTPLTRNQQIASVALKAGIPLIGGPIGMGIGIADTVIEMLTGRGVIDRALAGENKYKPGSTPERPGGGGTISEEEREQRRTSTSSTIPEALKPKKPVKPKTVEEKYLTFVDPVKRPTPYEKWYKDPAHYGETSYGV